MSDNLTSSVAKINQPTNAKRDIIISKALSKLLRHQAESQGLTIDNKGFVSLQDLIKHKYLKSMHTTPDDVFRIVKNNSKKRFKVVIRDNLQDKEIDQQIPNVPISKYFVCALQGHSMKSVDSSFGMIQLKDDDWPDIIVHGTFFNKLELIKKSGGLKRMGRNHIHFASGLPKWITGNSNEVVSGIRKCDVLIYLDIEKIKESDLVFYKSGNNVILSDGDENGIVGNCYFLKVTDIKGNPINCEIL